MCPPNPWKAKREKELKTLLTGGTPLSTVEGGTEGSVDDVPKARLHASSAPEELNLAEELDVALGAVCGCFAAALRPTMKDAARTFDTDMDYLLGVLHAWKATFDTKGT